MQLKRMRLLQLVCAAGATVALADSHRIAGVTEGLNARATSAPTQTGDDGTMQEGVGKAAWTVWNPNGANDGCSISVAVLGAAVQTQIDDVVNNLIGDARIASVTGIDTRTVTPSVGELAEFDAVMVFTNSTPQSSVSLGNNLADYVDGGGGVVLTMFAMNASVATRTMEGRFLTANYYCIERNVGSSITGNATIGTRHVPNSPLLDDVKTFDGGSSSFRPRGGLNPNATRIADWSSGEILIAERTDLNGGRVDLGFFCVSQLQSGGSWLPSTNGAELLRNSVVVASGCLGGGCDPCDTNCDGAVDAFDIEPFIDLLVNGGPGCSPCAADTDGNGVVDAFDVEPFINCLVGP